MKKLLLFAVLALTCCVSTVRAEITPEKRAEIDKMFRLTGMQKLMDQMVDQMTASMAKGMPSASPEFWVKVKAKMNTQELLDQIYPVYDKYYTLEDLKAVNAFYESPAGQKILASMPQVVKECQQIGEDWGRKVAAEALSDIHQEERDKK